MKAENYENLFYYPSINEGGWQEVGKVNKKLSSRPDLDKKLIFCKVRGILTSLHTNKLIYISNGSLGDCIATNVVKQCRKRARYDQYSIMHFIMQDPNLNNHQKH